MEARAPATTSGLTRPPTAPPIFQAGHEGSIPFARSHLRPLSLSRPRSGPVSAVRSDCARDADDLLRARHVPVPCALGSAAKSAYGPGARGRPVGPRRSFGQTASPNLDPVSTRLDLGACGGTEQTRPRQARAGAGSKVLGLHERLACGTGGGCRAS